MEHFSTLLLLGDDWVFEKDELFDDEVKEKDDIGVHGDNVLDDGESKLIGDAGIDTFGHFDDGIFSLGRCSSMLDMVSRTTAIS